MGSDISRRTGEILLTVISIHAPRMGSDESPVIINPVVQFQSTLPAWGATGYYYCSGWRGFISIHAPRMGSDLTSVNKRFSTKFQSTLPAWGATKPISLFDDTCSISIHAPRMGSDLRAIIAEEAPAISIHAPRMGSDSTVKAYSNDRIKRSTLREPHFLFSKNACFSPIVSMCAATSRTKNQRIRVSFGSYPGLAPTCFTLDWYRFPRL